MLVRNARKSRSASPSLLWLFVFDIDEAAIHSLAVQFGDRDTRLVAFHVDKTKAFALACKYVPGEFERMDTAERREQRFEGFFGCGGRQFAYK